MTTATPRPYPQLLRGPRHRWWRPLLGTAVLLGAALVLGLVVLVGAVVLQAVGLVDLAGGDEVGPAVLLANNLALAALIPLVALAVHVGQGWRPRWLSSVEGGLRWRWLLVTVAAVVVVQAVATALLLWWDGVPDGRGTDVVLLLLVVALTTPLQAAGEEYLFRGWLSQSVGSLFARAGVGAVVAGAVSATLFALAHGQQDPALFADRFAFGVLASVLTWATGGLEAAIAAHAANNVAVFVPVVLTGGLTEAVGITSIPWTSLAADVALMAVTGVVVLLLARRLRPPRLGPGVWGPPATSGSIAPR